MRSIPADDVQYLGAKVTAPRKTVTVEPEPPAVETPAPAPESPPLDLSAITEAVNALPSQLAEALKNIPAPVIAPRPAGAWVIDVSRDSYGQLDKMTANFHETKQ